MIDAVTTIVVLLFKLGHSPLANAAVVVVGMVLGGLLIERLPLPRRHASASTPD